MQRFRSALEARVGAPLDTLEMEAARGALDWPTLVVYDRSDRVATEAATSRVIAQLGDVSTFETSGLSHYRILRDPSVCGRASEFITRARTSSSFSSTTQEGVFA
jgi:hypothetical protein